MASNPELIKRFESNIPRVETCCCFFGLNVGGTLMSIFSVAAGLIYIGRAIAVLYNVKEYEDTLEDDDALKMNDDFIWIVYITTLFVGFCLLISAIYLLIGSSKRMAHHVYPFLIAILFSAFWAFVLGTIEVFNSDTMAVAFYAFCGLQIYMWVCAVSLYNQLLELEKNPQKPTRTDV